MVSTNNNNLLHTFSIDFTSDVDDSRYRGTFTTKKLTIRDMTQLGVIRTQLCGGLHYNPATPGQGIDADTYNINSMMAHLQLTLTEFPDWWNLDQLTDLDLLSEVYKEVISFENNFSGSGSRAKGAGSGGRSQEASSKTEAGANPAGVVEQVVAGQVSASLEP